MVLTRLKGTRERVLDRASELLGGRVSRLGSAVNEEVRCDHREASVAEAIEALWTRVADLVLVAGASAIVDVRDVVPAGIEAAGGELVHFGMPVDPGNLLLLARVEGDVPVIGVPGCARSPGERLRSGACAPSRACPRAGRPWPGWAPAGCSRRWRGDPTPREGAVNEARAGAPRIGAVVLAAGQSRRMGERNKLLEPVQGTPMLARVVDAVLATTVRPVVVVTGHEQDRVRDVRTDGRG